MLHAAVVSYRRIELTEETVASFLATVTVPYTLVVVDNGSPPATVERLERLGVPLILLGENRYPGYATNRGWEQAPADADLLLRSDNDTRWLPGWCDEMVEAFARPAVGIYGPTAAGDEEWTQHPVWPVGGNAVLRRSLWDAGIRYSDEPWSPDWVEAKQLTQDVWAAGYERVFGARPGIEYLDDGDEEYRLEMLRVRGLPAV